LLFSIPLARGEKPKLAALINPVVILFDFFGIEILLCACTALIITEKIIRAMHIGFAIIL